MGGRTEGVDVQLIDIDRKVTESLDGIRMEGYTPFPGDPADLGNRFDCADFIVGVHDRN